ncbi:MAG: sigma-54-dependent transcriptional regulator [Candidatus Nitrospinota bacterium M3_3B_026]
MREAPRILLIDDEEDLLESCVRILEDEGYEIVTTTRAGEALDLARRVRPWVVVTDFRMPGKDGMMILGEMREEFPGAPVIMISAYATINGVVEAVKQGAFDYVTKPFSADQLIITVRRAVEKYRMWAENRALRKELERDFFNHHFVGKHPSFLKVVEMIRKVAGTESNVLIRGETGSGKEMAARAIHLHSHRAEGPFIVTDCSTVTKDLLEAAPAGGDDGKEHARKSVFEAADGGTLYLERVEDLDASMQARLLRILQDRKVVRRGEWEWVPVDVRVLAGTTISLSEAMVQKRFRENLYYCLNVVSIDMPPLRERKEDVGILCDNFFNHLAKKGGEPPPKLSAESLARLMEYDWPGNVRQLRNVVERAASLAEDGLITVELLPEEVRTPRDSLNGVSFKEARRRWLERFERVYLENLLLSENGNISKASEKAGVARMSLYRMLKRTGLNQMIGQERAARGKAREDGEEKSGGKRT